MKHFAYILMGPIYNPTENRCEFTAGNTRHSIYTVRDFSEAQSLVKTLVEQEVGAIEVCGAFGRDRALALIELTQGKVPISYVAGEPEQDDLRTAFFRGK